MKLNFSHLSFAQLADLVEKRLSIEERSTAQEHLNACRSCAEQFAQLEQTIATMRMDMAEDVPSDVSARAINLFRPRTSTRTTLSVARRVLAALSFDSMQLTPQFGVRSGQATARQLLYNADEIDLDVRVEQRGAEWAVTGQVLARTCGGGKVELASLPVTVQAELNEQCEFTLPAVPAGRYTLRLRLADTEIEVPDLVLQS